MALTTLANVKQYAYAPGDTASTDDALLQLMINQLSNAILDYIQRPKLFKSSYTEVRDGVGNNSLMLRNYPVISVSSVKVGTQSIPASSSFGQIGYTLDVWDGTYSDNPQRITLFGYQFCRGQNNVQIQYSAGYVVTNEAYTITATSSGLQKYTAQQPYGAWGQDDGVTYTSSGAALTAVTSAPTAGQYQVSNGVYQFSSSDAGLGVNINYSYIPSAVEQACILWVVERYKYKDRVGQKSKTVGGQETAAYDTSAMPAYVELLLNPYKKWLPL